MKTIKVNRKPIKCLKCGEKSVVEILYGMPTEEARQLYEEGKLVIGGCCFSDRSPKWACTNCKTEYLKTNDKNI